MSNEYLEVKNLPWNQNPPENTFNYKSIKNKKEGKNGAMIYHFTGDPDNLMSGEGVYELQLKLAYIFKEFWFDDFYKPYYMENEDYRKALTSGIYGPKTTEMIMHFQKIYMAREFKGNWNPENGFGSFGENTKDTLQELFLEVRRNYTERKNNARAEAAAKFLSKRGY